jgi:hypothetical protein
VIRSRFSELPETALSRTPWKSALSGFAPKRTCVIIRESAVQHRSRDHKISHQFLARVSGLSRIARIRLMQPAVVLISNDTRPDAAGERCAGGETRLRRALPDRAPA